MSATRPITDVQRTRVRAWVAGAARVVAPLWPAETFIAVNPLGGWQDLAFEEAALEAGRTLGAHAYPPLSLMRRAHADGRVTDGDLRRALLEGDPGLTDLPGIELASGHVTAADLLLADLVHGPETAATIEPAPTTGAWCDRLLGTQIAERTDALVSRWCAAFLDEGGAAWAMPGREHGLYGAWRELAPHDPGLRRAVGRAGVAALRELPTGPADAVLNGLSALGVEDHGIPAELRAQLARHPGWAGYLRRRAEWASPADARAVDLTEYLAIRLTVEAALVRAAAGDDLPALTREISESREHERPAAQTDPAARLARALDALGLEPRRLDPIGRARALATLARLPDLARADVWLRAYEGHYRDELLATLTQGPSMPARDRPTAQVVCCIDVRSEGLRRHLEHQGPYETLGFAGFFGLAIRYRGLGDAMTVPLCPVLLSPTADVEELAAPGDGARAARSTKGRATLASFERAFHAGRDGVASPFSVAEAGGWVAGPLAAARTFAGRRQARTRARLRRAAAPSADTTLTVTSDGLGPGLTDDEQVQFADTALRTMGLTTGLARIVLLCAHGSHSENNPYASALDCGACGGRQGGPNARLAAEILNRTRVRTALAERGVLIPDDTLFVAGQHDTTTDRVTLLDAEDRWPASHADDLERLRHDLAAAGAALAAERAQRLPGPGAPEVRAYDWAQVRPEWGLVRNAAFLIGPREMSAGLDLGCRVFLHSYRADDDADGTALETILTAPLIVAQWINAQYYASTVDPERFGAGDKTLLSVAGTIGVVQGPGGDLRVGLPWQSVATGDEVVHEPMRLLAVVQAPTDRIDALIARHEVLRELFGGGWIALAARPHGGAPWQLRARDGRWSPWSPTHPHQEARTGCTKD